ncbi:YIR protein [Plasmodium yoelii]|uniref:YIR protein n=1 Tax=Plasmodium yoelii TaxID=5861 RepID=A0A077X7G2_PLAYE|nr:YIR protein [Plasmodium yoelii]
MNKQVCKRFEIVWSDFIDNLDSSENFQFKSDECQKKYCSNNNCDNNFGKINAVCLYFFDAFFKDSSLFEHVAKSNINIVEYIMIWLSYMLNLIKKGENDSLNYFYEIYIKGGQNYNKVINGVESYYKNYKDLIDRKKYFLSMNKSIIFKFYEAFKSLCSLYNELDDDNQNCKKYLDDNNDFFKKYEELKKDSSITIDNSYKKLLSTLLNDYNNLKNKCNGTSSVSSIASKLFIVLSIFGAIAIFLGVSYKYSLFGFRKRFQKQKLREKLKNIKKRMNQ